MAYKQKHQYGFRDSLEKGDPEKVIYGQYFDDEFKSIEEALEAIDPDSDGKVEINEIDGLQDALDNKADKDHTHEEYLTDAPDDGAQYVRESGAWAEVTIPEAGISEPTSDGKPYSRQVEGGQVVGAWVEAPTTDDIEYLDGRIDAIEGNISGGGGFVEAPDDGDDYARNGKSPAWVKTYNAEYIDALEADYKNADAGKADKDHNHAISDVTGLQTALDGKADAGHNHDSDYAPLGHTHTTDEITGLDDKISEIEGDITDLEGAVGELTGQLALGGSYNASTGLVVTANLSSFTAGQPLPDYSTVPNTFVIVVEAGNNPEELGEGDWLVAGQSGWVAIKYGTAGSVDWDNISNVPDFDLAYAPIDHTHEIADVDGLQDALDAAGESLWTQNGDNIYYSDGNVGIGIDNPYCKIDIKSSPTSNLSSNESQLALRNGIGRATYLTFDNDSNLTVYNTGDSGTGGDTVFEQPGGEAMRITKDGNVGIGAQIPTAKLSVNGTYASETEGLQVIGIGQNSGQLSPISFHLQSVGWGTSHQATISAEQVSGSNGGADLFFSTSTTGFDNPTERMRIDANGRVGIGAEPNAPLHVKGTTNGNLYVRAASLAEATLTGTALSSVNDASSATVPLALEGSEFNFVQSNAVKVKVDTNGNVGIGKSSSLLDGLNIGDGTNSKSAVVLDGSSAPRIQFHNGGTAFGYISDTIYTLGVVGSDTDLGIRTQNNLVFSVDTTECMRIDATGRVGIGGTPSRSTKEIEEEAEATLRNWDSKDKKPTKAELIKKLAERTIGGGTAKLQVAGDGYFSGDVNAGTVISNGRTVIGSASIYDNYNGNSVGISFMGGSAVGGCVGSGAPADGEVSLGRSDSRWKDGHFSGTVNAATINGKVTDVPDHVKAITPTQIANWDAGTGGGGGATTDGRISDTQITNWDTAYGWGNHASAGYQPAGSYAASNHNHNGVYAPASHTHSEYLTSASLNGYATESWVNSQGFAKGSFVPTSGNTTIAGTLTATDFVASSDERLKDEITPMPVGLIDDIKPAQWTWKDSGKKSAGVIAQQLQEIGLDDFVTEGEDGMLGVNYNALVSVLLAEVINLKKELAK